MQKNSFKKYLQGKSYIHRSIRIDCEVNMSVNESDNNWVSRIFHYWSIKWIMRDGNTKNKIIKIDESIILFAFRHEQSQPI